MKSKPVRIFLALTAAAIGLFVAAVFFSNIGPELPEDKSGNRVEISFGIASIVGELVVAALAFNLCWRATRSSAMGPKSETRPRP